MKKLRDAFLRWYLLGIASPTGKLFAPPVGVTPDNYAMWGILGAVSNIDAALGYGMTQVASATGVTLIAPQIVAGIINRTGAAGSAFNDATDTALNIISALPNTVPSDGTYQFIIRYLNSGTGQTATITAGTGVTLTGTMTIANNAWRDFLITIRPNLQTPASGTVEINNIGSGTL